MNSCSECMWRDAKISAAPFLYKGTAYCRVHLILHRGPGPTLEEVTSDASKVPKKKEQTAKPKVKWQD